MRLMRRFLSIIVLVAAAPAAAASSSVSATTAETLVTEMMTRHLDAIAAEDSTEPGRFVAALLIPGGQLLTVSAEHPWATLLRQKIASGAYRDVYLDLQGTPTPKGKFFVQDTGADGIRDGHNGAVDVVYEDGTRQTLFDRTLAKQLPGTAYDSALADADRRYNQALTALVTAIQAMPDAPAATQSS
jgi:hypothetical protein